MTENEEENLSEATLPPGKVPRRSPGRPRWKTPEDKMVSRQIYMNQREWDICQKQGNASAFLRRLVHEFDEGHVDRVTETGSHGTEGEAI